MKIDKKTNISGLLKQLKISYPDLNFNKSNHFSWSPLGRVVSYVDNKDESSTWSLLHEVSHGILRHSDYEKDIDLVKMEVEAWDMAKEISKNIGVDIDEDYIQNCLDTYRDWLHKRSMCPSCQNSSIQYNQESYKCFNCNETWTVTKSKLCRPYRLRSKPNHLPYLRSAS